jgi:multidrug efflux pump subunit AcrA (membrane-fusion protein)
VEVRAVPGIPAIAGVSALLLTGLLTGCSGSEDQVVQVREVGRTTVAESVDAPGTVAARASAVVTAPADVQVDQVLVQDGATVQPGAVLVQLSSESAQQRLRQARSALAAAEAGRVEVPPADLGPLQDALDAAAEASFAAGRAAAASLVDPAQRAAAEQQVREAEARYHAAALASRRSQQQLDAGARGPAGRAGVGAPPPAAAGPGGGRGAQAVVDALTVTAPIAAWSPSAVRRAAVAAGRPGRPARGAAGGAAGAGGRRARRGRSAGPDHHRGRPAGGQPAVLRLAAAHGHRRRRPDRPAEVDETDVLLVAAGQRAVVELDAVPGRRTTRR